jgi:hypothetical protein
VVNELSSMMRRVNGLWCMSEDAHRGHSHIGMMDPPHTSRGCWNDYMLALGGAAIRVIQKVVLVYLIRRVW